MGINKQGWEKRRNNGKGTAWNKGKKLPNLSDSHKKKISDAHKKSGITPPNWKGKKRSIESVEMSASKRRGVARPKMRGDKNHLWRGGITSINAKIRSSLEYKLWRRGVFERDNFTCIWCGDKQKTGHKVILHADHIKPFACYPELRFALDNGRTLCIDCHKTTESYLKKTINGLA